MSNYNKYVPNVYKKKKEIPSWKAWLFTQRLEYLFFSLHVGRENGFYVEFIPA